MAVPARSRLRVANLQVLDEILFIRHIWNPLSCPLNLPHLSRGDSSPSIGLLLLNYWSILIAVSYELLLIPQGRVVASERSLPNASSSNLFLRSRIPTPQEELRGYILTFDCGLPTRGDELSAGIDQAAV